RRLLIRNFRTLLDGRFLLVGRDDARRGNDLTAIFVLGRGQLEIHEVVRAEHAERDAARRAGHRQVHVVTLSRIRTRRDLHGEGTTAGLQVAESRADRGVGRSRRPGSGPEAVVAVRLRGAEAQTRTELALEVIVHDDDASLDLHL